MDGGVKNRFSAAGSALGYLAQIEYGLLLVLKRMDDTVELRLSMETADDLVLDSADSSAATELWQTKHHQTTKGSLGDASTDLWKSLHNWIESVSDDCQFVLFSTASAPHGSAAQLLGKSRSSEDVRSAQQCLEKIAVEAGNEAHAAYYARFLGLDPAERLQRLERVTVLDEAAQAADLTKELQAAVRKTVPANRRAALVQRLRGWWHERAMEHIARVATGETDWIGMTEVEGNLHRIAESLRGDNLPLDFTDMEVPTDDEVEADDRIFVDQLRLIMLHHSRIRTAIHDHNRAFKQRSQWQREDLLDPRDLAEYDRKLIREWQRAFLPIAAGEEVTSDVATAQREALERYVALENRDLPEIKPEVRSGYIPMGSLHILADRLDIGWHRDWLELLRHRIDEAGGMSAEGGAA